MEESDKTTKKMWKGKGNGTEAGPVLAVFTDTHSMAVVRPATPSSCEESVRGEGGVRVGACDRLLLERLLLEDPPV